MASTFRPTGSYSNLTRLELERLRRAEAYASGKILTIGDSGEGSENIVGPGLDVTAEPLAARVPFYLEAVNSITPSSEPGRDLGTVTQVYGVPCENVSWYGPDLVFDAYNSGEMISVGAMKDATPGLNFTLFVQSGDVLLIKPTGGASGDNRYAVGVVNSVLADTLLCTPIIRPYGTPPYDQFVVDGQTYSYIIIRPNAIKLFAAPWSGATGREQTFFTVAPGAAVNTLITPTVEDLWADQIDNIVEPSFASRGDRANSVYPAPAMTHLLDLGYRVVLYPDNGTGTGPDLTKPIYATHPIIDPAIPSNDQRINIDYRSGTIRLSCAPGVGGDIKPSAGCVDPTTGRLNLYAVFWAVDTSMTKQTAAGLHVTRSDQYLVRPPARLWFESAVSPEDQAWWIGSSATQRGAYVQDSDSEPARIGVDTKTGYRRHLTYDNTRLEWRMHLRETPSEHTHPDAFDPTVADRTALTISDSSYEPQHPGAATPKQVVSTPNQGLRNSADEINEQLQLAGTNGYGTVHLRKGTHYVNNPIHVPPGVTLEGAGAQTRLEKIGAPGPVLYFGPNTPWGVYDFSYGPIYAPTSILAGVKNRRIEGQDLCWNANKKVWGVVIADVTSQAVWFNEMRTDGTWVLPGNGIDIKNNTRPIMTADTVASTASQQWHTPGHHPRIAYHPFLNRYGVVWCVRDEVIYQNSALQTVLFELDANNNLTILHNEIREGATDNYLNPSVAFNQENPTDSALRIFVHYRGASSYLRLIFQEVGSSTMVPDVSTTATEVVSSTDVTVDSDGSVVVVWSVRPHPLLGSALANGVVDSSTPRRFSSVDLPNPIAAGVIPGSRLHHLNKPVSSANGGKDYVITNVTATYVEIQSEEESTELPPTDSSFYWAISPPSRIWSMRWSDTFGGWISSMLVNGHPITNNYNGELREPDFVRLSRGSSGCLVTFQAFNTTAFLARSTLPNFDNNINPAFYDGNPVCKSIDGVYREHVSTCAILIGGPTPYNLVPGPGPSEPHVTYPMVAQQTQGPAKSLGASEPLVQHANALHTNVTNFGGSETSYGVKRGPHLEISARHIVHKWTLTRPMSLIPDVTWTGQDWVVVSPTLSKIESDTGTIRIIGGIHYLVDPTFCFGANSQNGIDGNWLPRTISGRVLILDGTPTEYALADVVSDHCVQLDAATPFSDGTRVTWRMISDSTSLTDNSAREYGFKIMGFRVASDGTLIQGSSRLLDYMPPQWSPDDTHAKVGKRFETVSRRRTFPSLGLSSGGGNDPMMFGTLGPKYNGLPTSPRAGWSYTYPTSRISGDIGFQGICAGAPIPPGALSPEECPLVALEWGENFYALAARQTSGKDSLWTNRTLVFRQSFGPYNAEVKNLVVIGKNVLDNSFVTGIPSNSLQAVSRRHVYTRFGLPNSPAGGFATDGYRNCFVYPAQVGQADEAAYPTSSINFYVASGGVDFTVRWSATYTDAIGNSPIMFQGPPPAYMVEPLENVGGILSMPANDCQLREHLAYDPTSAIYPSSPVVIWTGSRFAAFWTEEDKNPPNTRLAGSYICMATFTGGEATYVQDNSLCGAITDSDIIPSLSAFVKVSCGLGVGSNLGVGDDTNANQITVCDAAYSGRVFAVVWTAGLYRDTGASALQAGTAVGVTIFSDGSPNGGGVSYLIDTGPFDTTPVYREPKVVWDGLNFVLFVVDNGKKTYCLSIPETGLGVPAQTKRIASEHMFLEEVVIPYGSRTLGTLDANGNIVLNNGYRSNACQPGDILLIDKVQRAAKLFPTRTDGVCSGATLTSATGLFKATVSATRVYQAGGPYTFDQTNNTFSDLSQNFTSGGVQVGNKLVVISPAQVAGEYAITEVSPGGDTHLLRVMEPWPVPTATTGTVEYYVDKGVRPGDHVIIVGPSANSGRYIVKNVDSDTQITITTIFPLNTTGEDFYIERMFDDYRLSGPHVVRGYDPETETIGTEMRQSTWQSGDTVIGSILSGSPGKQKQAVRYGTAHSEFIPPSAPLTDLVQIKAYTSTPEISKILGVVYLDSAEELIILYQTNIGELSLVRMSRTNFRATATHHTNLSARSATLGWNGHNLLVVYTDKYDKVCTLLISPNFTHIERQVIAGSVLNDALRCPMGNLPGQVPGPLYDALVTPSNMQWGDVTYNQYGQLQPRPKKVDVKWNDKLSRWVISVSYIWGMEGTCAVGSPTPYANNPPLWPLTYDAQAISGSIEQAASIQIGGTYVGRVITGRFYVPTIQPGMRIYFGQARQHIQMTVMKLGTRIPDPNPNGVSPTDIYTSLTVDVDASELTATEVAEVNQSGSSYNMWTDAREDVFVWTMQEGHPAVKLVDADGCALTGVILGGSVVDISESYTAAARPTWRTAGDLVGAAAVGGSAGRGRVQKRVYTRSFLTPENKIETLCLNNCRSRTPVKYGRNGPPDQPTRGVSKPEGRRS